MSVGDSENDAYARGPRKKPAWGEDIQSTEAQRETREQILFETAARFFNRYGFHGTTLSRLTEELGLTKGALYYYVKDKSDLLYQLHLKAIEATRQTNARAEADGVNGYDRVRLIFKYYVLAVTQSHTEAFSLMEEGALKPEQAAEIAAKRKALQAFVCDQINAGIADGSIVPCDAKLASHVMIGAVAWISKWYDRDGEIASEDLARMISDMLGRMVSATPSAALEARPG